MKKAIILGVFIIFGGLYLNSCSKNDTTTTPTSNAAVKTVVDLDCDTTGGRAGRFTFFSFKNNAVVASTDSATTKWDIGFSSTTIITNSASRGPGLGGAIVYKLQAGESFELLKSAPATGWAIDTSVALKAIKTGSGNGWYLYDAVNNVIKANNQVVLFIRTADGKYAKMYITSYYKGNLQSPDGTSLPRYYNFKFVYQDDGTRNF